MNVTQRPHAAADPGQSAPVRPAIAALQRLGLARLRALPPQAEADMLAQHDAELEKLLPLLGPLFGLGVVLFSAWDFLIAPADAGLTLLVRCLCVLAGSIAYLPNRLQWNVQRRCGHIYLTHAGAIIVCEALLPHGLVYGLAGLTACTFTLSVSTLRFPSFFRMLAPPALLFAALSAWRLPWLLFVSGVMQFLFAVGLAATLMLVVRLFHQKSFLLEKELLHLSQHDSLTGACNRRYLEGVAERELAVARRHGHTLAVAMLDIDHFKCVNDTYGHEVGDRVLQELVRTCLGQLRAIDHFGRLGGEEFVCVLPQTDREEALRCAERLRASLAAISIATPFGPLHITASVGVAIYGPGHADWQALLKDADEALYSAKRAGRNRVTLAGAPPSCHCS